MNFSPKSVIQSIQLPSLEKVIDVKREDLNHPLVSGNKLRKLKYNLIEARNQGFVGLLTFGGAYSNHILAVAACGKELGFKTIGFIRGEEVEKTWALNPTLQQAVSLGMKLEFLDRKTYQNKADDTFISFIKSTYPEYFMIPEGGTNELAIRGCEEILTYEDYHYNYICCSVGTGGTIAGIINSSLPTQKVLGFTSLKGDFLTNDIRKFVTASNWEIIQDFHFGGYGKITKELISFLNKFYDTTKVPLDPIYTGKAMYGLYKMIEAGYFKCNSKILFIHTGGIQGIRGVNQKLVLKGEPQILNYES